MIIEAYNYLQKIIDMHVLKSAQTIVPTERTGTNSQMTSSETEVVEVKSEVEHVIEEIEFDEDDYDDFFTENAPPSVATEDSSFVSAKSAAAASVTIQEINVNEELPQSSCPDSEDTGQLIKCNQGDTNIIFKCIECNTVLPEPDDPFGDLRNMTLADKFQHAYANISSKNPVCSSFLICPQCKMKKCSPKPD